MNKYEKYLLDKGFKPALLGFDYLVYAMELVDKDKSVLNSITKILYPTVANRFDTTAPNAERAMRHSIEITGSEETNGNFIARAVLELKDVK